MTPPVGLHERRSGASAAALANSDRLARLIKTVSVLLAGYVAIAVTIASVIGVANSIRSVDHAKKGAAYAFQALEQAKMNHGIASDVRSLVAQAAPCLTTDPPDSPGCVRQARSEKLVGDAIADIKASVTASLNTHDLNAKAAHDQILRQRGGTTSTTSRTPITSLPPRTSVTAATTTPPATVLRPLPAPVTTTPVPTTCVPHKKERCR